jgi:translation elongation factor EF-Tu-like GTPase
MWARSATWTIEEKSRFAISEGDKTVDAGIATRIA